MTAAEADARFEALVSDHRRKKGRKASGGAVGDRVTDATGVAGRATVHTPAGTRDHTDATVGRLVVVIVFCLGVASGAILPHRPLTALLVGIPLILVGLHLLRRWRRDGRR